MSERLEEFIEALAHRTPGEDDFHQAVYAVYADVFEEAIGDEQVRRARIPERLTEPDRTLIFRVVWEDDEGELRTNRAYRVQYSNALGPYKGGLRFVGGLQLSTLKFLGFEQTFKNALTGLPMGGAKGGADFDPRGRSDAEVMRFCHSLMAELARHIGERIDVPAGDIGVGEREIGYMFGQYKRLQNRFAGVLTGKGMSFGGSAVRAEATGYGAVYFTELMLERAGERLEGKRCALSGSGNVAIYCAEKLIDLDARVISMSDSDGTVYDPDGIDADKLAYLKDLKLGERRRIGEYAERFGCEYLEGERPWGLDCDLAIPCATQNEIEPADARTLVSNGCQAVVEGANMPLTPEAAKVLRDARLLVAPGKAANAGGVAVSGLEQSQNVVRVSFSRETVDRELRRIMGQIHDDCVECGGTEDGWVDYVRGANRAGFQRVCRALLAYGAV